MADSRGDEGSPATGASVFNARGQRLNEIDLDNRAHPKTHADMTDEDWEQAAAAVREFDGGAR
ncbi:hypothetical protein ILP97_44660 [Amycolatopsis sp. H6(2020)]|nr:hypothetical protein [Amycolatopsis sp. H6(2020)]